MLSFHLLLGVPSVLFPSWFPNSKLLMFLFSPFVLHSLPTASSLTWPFHLYMAKTTNLEAPRYAVFSPAHRFIFHRSKCSPQHPVLKHKLSPIYGWRPWRRKQISPPNKGSFTYFCTRLNTVKYPESRINIVKHCDNQTRGMNQEVHEQICWAPFVLCNILETRKTYILSTHHVILSLQFFKDVLFQQMFSGLCHNT
jgi:hypothetical protein